MEIFVRWIQGKSGISVKSALSSISISAIRLQAKLVIFKGFEITAYVWIYENYHIIDLPWDSPITWWICFIGYDFMFYWFHRMSHGKLALTSLSIVAKTYVSKICL